MSDQSCSLENDVILAIDIGSSSVRCLAYEVVAEKLSLSSVVSSYEEERQEERRKDRQEERRKDRRVALTEDHALVEPVAIRRLAASSRSLRVIEPITGHILQLTSNSGSGQKNLLECVDDCVEECLEQLSKRYPRTNNDESDCDGNIRSVTSKNTWQVVGIGFSTLCMNLIGVDYMGNIIGDDITLTYACNTDVVNREVVALQRELGPDRLKDLYSTTGSPLHSSYALAQLRVLYRTHLSTTRQIYKWQSLAGIIINRWTGCKHLPMSYSEASWTGLLNYHTCQYDQAVLSLLPLECRAALPDLVDYDEIPLASCALIGRYLLHWKALGCSPTVRLFLGIGDGACANIGSKCASYHRVACTIGTSAAARVCFPLPIVANPIVSTEDNTGHSSVFVQQGLFCYRIHRTQVLVGGALTDGGSVVEWALQLLNLQTNDDLERCMKQVEVLLAMDYSETGTSKSQAHLCMIPFLSGERSVGFRPGATGAIIGLNRETTPALFMKACLEGVILRIKAVVERIQNTGVMSNTPDFATCIVASGKALEVNSLMRQMLADCTGLEVIYDSETEESTSRGVALLLVGAIQGRSKYDDENTDSLQVLQPSSTANQHWNRAFKAQENLIEALSPLFLSSIEA